MQARVARQLGVERRRRACCPGATATGWPSTAARTSTSVAVSAIHGARMNTACTGVAVDRRGRPRTSAPGGRTRCARRVDVEQRRGASRSSMISPAHVPNTGVPARDELAQRLGEALALDPERHRRRLAAGHDQPVEPVEVGGRRAPRARRRRATRRIARVGGEAALQGEDADCTNRGRRASCSSLELARLERLHRACRGPRRRAATRSGSRKCVVASTIARARALGVLGLEDARADEDRLGAELHHQRGVGRRGDAAGAEQRDGQLALARRRARTMSSGACSSLAAVEQLGVVERRRGGGSRR